MLPQFRLVAGGRRRDGVGLRSDQESPKSLSHAFVERTLEGKRLGTVAAIARRPGRLLGRLSIKLPAAGTNWFESVAMTESDDSLKL
jgi:hypothetical protein